MPSKTRGYDWTRSARGSPNDDSMRLKKTYSSREVAALTGLSARQLQSWNANRLLSPTVPSHRTDAGGYTERRYTPIELFEVLVLADLRRRGFTVHQLHTLVRILRERFGQRLFDATGGGGTMQLLTDGRDIYGRTVSGAFYNLLKAPAQPLLVVGEGMKELSGTVRMRRKRSKAGRQGKKVAGRRATLSGSGRSSRDRRPDAE